MFARQEHPQLGHRFEGLLFLEYVLEARGLTECPCGENRPGHGPSTAS